MSTEFNDVEASGSCSKVSVTRFKKGQQMAVQLVQSTSGRGDATTVDGMFDWVDLNEAQAKQLVARLAEAFDWND